MSLLPNPPSLCADGLPPVGPDNISRRTFIKRTSATSLGIVLALHVFRSEAVAQEGGGSSIIKWTLKLGTPPSSIYEETGNELKTYIPLVADGEPVPLEKTEDFEAILPDEGSFAGLNRFTGGCKIAIRPLKEYSEVLLGRKKEKGIFKDTFEFGWEVAFKIELDPFVFFDPRGEGTWNGEGRIVPNNAPVTASNTVSGSITINPDTGDKAKDPPHPVDVVVAQGMHPKFPCRYSFVLLKEANRVEAHLRLWWGQKNPKYQEKKYENVVFEVLPNDYWLFPPGELPDYEIDLSDALECNPHEYQP